MDNIWEWNTVAAKIETRSLKRLKSLSAPQTERKLISEFFRAAENERDLLRKVAGQAAVDYPELLRILDRKRADATQLKDEVVARIPPPAGTSIPSPSRAARCCFQGEARRAHVPDYGRRSPRKLLRAVVARAYWASASPAQALA